TKQVIAQGFAFFLPGTLEFDPNRPYTGCLLCGEVFQSRIDRRVPEGHLPHNSLIAKLAFDRRQKWVDEHYRTHSEYEHRQHRLSGRFATPDAAQKLASFGLFSAVDIVIDNEVENALKNAPVIPTNDAQC